MFVKSALRNSVRLLTAVSLLGLSLVQTGCEPEDAAAVAIGAGVIGVIVGAGIADDNDHDHCRGGTRRVCSTHHDRRGHSRTNCRDVYRSCGHRYEGTLRIAGLASAIQTSPEAAALASKYSLSFEAAELLVEKTKAAQDGNVVALKELGLANQDLQNLAHLEMISNESVRRVSDKLDTTPQTVENLLSSVIAEAKTQTRDIASPVWEACLARGKWKTPQNRSCNDRHLFGCSPATGATACTAAY